MTSTAAPALSIRGLSKSFGALAVAQDINIDLASGARVGLIGPNGAGKTTLVNLLTGTLAADAGSILLDGRAIERLTPEARVRRGLARTHQINTLLNETSARDNVAIAIAERDGIAWRLLRYTRRWSACREEAHARLRELGIAHAAERTVAKLPYGEQRLLEIAIALSLRPRVLLLDEPAAGVPALEAEVIHSALDRLSSDITVLMIEHDMDLVFRFAGEIIVLVQGRVLRRGTPADIGADLEVRSVYLGRSAM
jgi:branched-chain amino acid transport system ATP-binding protein